jgi:hypothetical protein
MRSQRICGLHMINPASVEQDCPCACAEWSSAEEAPRGAQAGDWPAAQRLLGALAAAGMEAAAAPEVARALCAAVSQRLAPRRAALYPDGPRGRCLLDKRARGPGLARRPVPCPPALVRGAGAWALATPRAARRCLLVITHACTL